MHHRRPSGPASAAFRAALMRGSQRLSRRSGGLLVVALSLGVAASAGLALPDPSTSPQAAPRVSLDAAHRQLPGSGQAAPTPSGGTATAADSPAGSAGASAGSDANRHGDHRRQSRQPVTPPNPNCTLMVPSEPTGAAGLITPYRLVATDAGAGPCHEAEADQSAFVEAAIFDPAQHAVSIYHPLVVDANDRPAVPPVPVSVPPGAVVGVWFGFNGDTLTLSGPGAHSCVNGLPGSPFGQFAYCNARAFFAAANADSAFRATIPSVGTAADGRPCPTSRDFAVVDQDQSDNLATAYRVIDGRMAQTTPSTASMGTALTNGSDEGLVATFIAPALGCSPFTAPDQTAGGAQRTAALALNELSAAKGQAAPAALVPTSDPMTQVDGKTSTSKTDLYRAGVNQPPLATDAGQSPQRYCANILAIAAERLALNATRLRVAPAPTPDQPNLLIFLKARLQGTLAMLRCTGGSASTADKALATDGAAAAGQAARTGSAASSGTTPPGQPTGSGSGSPTAARTTPPPSGQRAADAAPAVSSAAGPPATTSSATVSSATTSTAIGSAAAATSG
jgi:hypothetical protein